MSFEVHKNYYFNQIAIVSQVFLMRRRIMLIHQYLERNAQFKPDKTAVVFQDNRLTYGEINEMANRLADALLRAGLKKYDRVAIYLDNSLETIISIYGVLKAGGIFSTLSPTLKAKKLEYIINNLEATFLLSHNSKSSIINDILPNCPTLKKNVIVGLDESDGLRDSVEWNDFLKGGSTQNPAVKNIDIDLANIIYTSGSTKDPKGVMMTHLSMRSAAKSIIEYLEYSENDIIMDVLPLSFDYGLYQVIMCFICGATIIIEKSFMYPFVVVDKIVKEKVTVFPIVPTILALLFQLKDLKKFVFPDLRCITNTGAALPVTHINKIREFFPNTRIYSMYGLTECKRVSYLPPDEINKRPTSVGISMPNQEVFIFDENGNQLGPGIVGELVVRGANVMKGYWKAPDETAERLKPGMLPGEMLLYTGDLFKKDEDGFLYFVARKDDIIKTRGERVSPKEIENTLHEIEGVIEAAVIPVPDEILGNAIKAFIVKSNQSPLTEKDVINYCKMNLESFMVPESVEFVDSFQKTSSGKIDKKVLK
jgi:amino acid adenylation domain-containing protein